MAAGMSSLLKSDGGADIFDRGNVIMKSCNNEVGAPAIWPSTWRRSTGRRCSNATGFGAERRSSVQKPELPFRDYGQDLVIQ